MVGDLLMKFLLGREAPSPDAVVLQILPDQLIGIEFRAIGREEEHLELPFKLLDAVPDLSRLVHGMAVQNQEHRLARPMHEPAKERADLVCGHLKLCVLAFEFDCYFV